MDFGVDEEFDYEEDEIVKDLFNTDFESKSSEDDKSKNTNLSSVGDDYLQINCSEEDENFLFKEGPSENVDSTIPPVKAQEDEKAGKKEEEKNGEKFFLRKEQCTQTKRKNVCNHYSGKKNFGKSFGDAFRKFKKKKQPFLRRTAASLTLNPWLPQWSFLSSNSAMQPPSKLVPSLGNHLPAQKPKFAPGQQTQNSQGPVTNKSPNSDLQFGFGLKTQNPVQHWSERLDRDDRSFCNKNTLDFNLIDNKNNFYNNIRSNDTGSGVFPTNGEIQKKSKVEKKTDIVPPIAMPVKCEEKKFPITLTALRDDEKLLVMQKKEARLKRFMQDDIIRKETKPLQSNMNERTSNVHLKMEDFPEQESKSKSGNSLTREGCQGNGQYFYSNNAGLKNDSSLLDKTGLNKVTLLKKQNPFETNSEFKTNATKIKQEVLWSENSKADSRVKRADEIKVPGDFEFARPSSLVVKSETSSPVKFIRTVSKSLDELRFKKPKSGIAEDSQKPKLFLAPQEPQEQASSQLTGCIVKVLNVSPSTTVDDILELCRRVGVVKEVKLNFPKENSVVIRFADSTGAENFFSLYHGQKMNNYFLNVIVF